MYVQLELQANVLPDEIYERKLGELEEKRFDLEEERDRIEEAYSAELVAIKSTPTNEMVNQQKIVSQQSANGPPPKSPKSPNGANRKRSPSKKQREEMEQAELRRESGWIKCSSKETHNASMKKKQRESEAALARTMTRKNGTERARLLLTPVGATTHGLFESVTICDGRASRRIGFAPQCL